MLKPDAFEVLRKYSWPGNIRELKETCERFAQGNTGIIDAAYLGKMLGFEASIKAVTDGWEEHVFEHGLKSYISMIEEKAVEESMRRNNGKITACIKELKISSSAFYRILQENQLQF